MHRPDLIKKTGILVAAMLSSLSATSISAQEIIDPTAPPDRFLRALEQAELPSGDAEAKASMLNKPVMVVERNVGGEWRRHTVINGKVATEGERIDLGTIRTISSDGVEITGDEETETRSVVDHAVIRESPGDWTQE